MVGPKGSEIVRIPKIATARKRIQIPIPSVIDKEGGSFEIDLGECHPALQDEMTLTFLLSQCGRCVRLQTFSLGARCYCQRTPCKGKIYGFLDVNRILNKFSSLLPSSTVLGTNDR